MTVWIGLDVGEEEHFADVLDDHGDPLFAASIGDDEADLVGLLDRAFKYGTPALVINSLTHDVCPGIASFRRCPKDHLDHYPNLFDTVTAEAA